METRFQPRVLLPEPARPPGQGRPARLGLGGGLRDSLCGASKWHHSEPQKLVFLRAFLHLSTIWCPLPQPAISLRHKDATMAEPFFYPLGSPSRQEIN